MMLWRSAIRTRSYSPAAYQFAIALLLASFVVSCIVEKNVDDPPETVAPEKLIEDLQSLTYTSWSPLEHEGRAGVVSHDPRRASPGLNLFNSLPRPSDPHGHERRGFA